MSLNIKGLEFILDNLLHNSEYAWWQWDITNNIVTFNKLKVTNLGYSMDNFKNCGFEAFTNLLHPDDYEPAMDAMRDYLTGKAPIYQIDYRIKKADNTYTWYMDRGMGVKFDENKKPLVLRGIVIDLGNSFNNKLQNKELRSLLKPNLPDQKGKSELLTICCVCRKMKLASPSESWVEAQESFINAFKGSVSHGLCDNCSKKLCENEVKEMK